MDFPGIVVARSTALLAVLAGLLAAAPMAQADVTPFGPGAEAHPCAPSDGVRLCSGTVASRVASFDGTPIDVDVALPATGDSNLPLIIVMHGWGGKKGDNTGAIKHWASLGYAAIAPTARGWGDSCGSASSRLASPNGCAQGWIKLARTTHEVRDDQWLAEKLADQGIVDGQRIGVTGLSYAGGQSMALAALKDRVMAPDGTLKPWVSPGGKPMRIAAAAPSIPWTDLTYSLLPNGRHLDYTIAPKDQSQKPVGVEKQSFVSGLYATGLASGYYAPPGTDPQADLTQWFALTNAGEPYNQNPQTASVVNEIASFHSSYGIDDSEAPAPLFISNGFTDDLFPVDEALRFYNRTKAKYPTTPLALMFFDYGHQRGQGKTADTARYKTRVDEWFARYVKGDASQPVLTGVETLTQTCPKAAPSGGPFDAPDWEAIHPGEVRFSSKDEKSFTGEGSDPSVSRAVDPVAGGGDPCATTAADDLPNTATYRLPKATGAGYTIMGSPRITTKLSVSGLSPADTQVVGRLWDVGPDGKQTLIARGLYRPLGDGSTEVFQLHPAGYKIAADHIVKLELLGADAPYARKSNGTFQTTVQGLSLALPVLEKPACGATGVVTPEPPVVPPGQTLAPDVPGGVTATGEPVKAGGTAPGKRGVSLRLKLRVKYRKAKGRSAKTCKRRQALVQVRGTGSDQIARVDLAKGKTALGRDKKAPYQLTLSAKKIRKGNYAATILVKDGRVLVLKGKLKRLC